MTDLTDWLTAQIDADERVAKGLAGATRIIGNTPDFYGVGGPAAADFWQRFDPARVLAECAAKRQIVQLHQPTTHALLPPECEWCGPNTAPGKLGRVSKGPHPRHNRWTNKAPSVHGGRRGAS